MPNNQNVNGVPLTSILINNAINSRNDPRVIDRSSLADEATDLSFQIVGLDCEANVTGSDRTTRPVFGFNYFRTCTQATDVSGNPVTIGNQRRCIVINGTTGEVLANLEPGDGNASTENQILINAINSVVISQGGDENLSTWAEEQSIPEGSRGENDDPDGDGIVNLLEYAYGSNPLVGDVFTVSPRIEAALSTGQRQFVFQRSKTANVTPFTFESSVTLDDFTSYVPDSEQVEVEDQGDTELVRITLPIEVPVMFLRLETSQP